LLKPVQPHPVLLIRRASERILAIADLHIGWEVALAEKGIHVPSQMPKILKNLLALLKLCKPTSLLFLGDVKHTIAKAEIEEWRDVPDFFEALIEKVPDIRVVLGNHDGNLEPLLPENVKIIPSTGLSIGDIGLFHGNSWPTPELLGCHSLVIGHVHPTVSFRDALGFRMTAQVWVKAKIVREKLARDFLKSQGVTLKPDQDAIAELQNRFDIRFKASELFIMPHFNDFLSGRPINRGGQGIAYLGPVLRSGCVDMENAEAYMLDGTYLGTVRQLRSLS